MGNVPEFVPFPKISRLRRGCVITEKIDGTNAQVYVTDDNQVFAASRNRWITPDDDNYGFASWVKTHQDELVTLGPGRHFGEWWGAGIQRRYGIEEKRFSLFNAARWGVTRPPCCHAVPILYDGVFSDNAVNAVLETLRTTGSVAAPGFMNPEGIVVYMKSSGGLFKFTLDGDGHKEAKGAA